MVTLKEKKVPGAGSNEKATDVIGRLFLETIDQSIIGPSVNEFNDNHPKPSVHLQCVEEESHKETQLAKSTLSYAAPGLDPDSHRTKDTTSLRLKATKSDLIMVCITSFPSEDFEMFMPKDLDPLESSNIQFVQCPWPDQPALAIFQQTSAAKLFQSSAVAPEEQEPDILIPRFIPMALVRKSD